MRLPTWKTCPACGNAIARVTTLAGKSMPLDLEPDRERGNVAVEEKLHEMVGVTLGVDALAEARAAGEDLYVSHFATCSDPARFRSES